MADWPDGCVDLVLTDPPYGIGDWNNRGINADRAFSYADNQQWDKAITAKHISLILKVSKNQIIWGANHFLELLHNTKQIFVWNKGLRKMHFNDCELAWCSQFKEACRVFDYHVSLNRNKLHPTQKPLALMVWCLEFLPEADLILDPFCGSGTTCVAAKKLGRRYIGIDISPEYCEIARKRLEAIDTGVPAKEAQAGQMALFGDKR
jgi:DNA modification methylase